MIHGKTVSGVRRNVDQYERNICDLEIDSTRVDHEMLRTGLAWHYVKFSDDEIRASLQAEAQENKLNIWSELGPVEPWLWRRWGSGKRKQWLASNETKVETRTNEPETAEATLTHLLNLNGNVRHNSSCRWFNNTKKGRLCTSLDGKACGKCGG